MAAVGRKNGSVGRPAVTLSASVAPTISSPIRIRTLSRCHSPGRKRQIQAQQHARRPAPRAAASRRSWRRRGASSLSPSASIFSISVAVSRRPVADDHLALADRDADRPRPLGGLVAGLGRELRAERRVRDDQRADELGREHPLGLVEPAGHPAGQAPVRVSATSVSRSSVRRVASRTRAASVRTAAQRAASRPTSVARGGVGQVRDGRLEERLAALRAEVGRERRVDPGDPSVRRPSCCAAAMAIAFSLVKSYCGGTAARAAASRLVGLDVALEVDRARRHDVPRWPARPRRTWSGGSGRMSMPRMAVSARIRIAAAIARRGSVAAREAVEGGGPLGQHGRVIGRRLSGSRRRGRPDRPPASAWTTSSLTRLPSARPRVRGESQPMTLPMSRAEVGAGRGDPLADEVGDLVVGQGRGQVRRR